MSGNCDNGLFVYIYTNDSNAKATFLVSSFFDDLVNKYMQKLWIYFSGSLLPRVCVHWVLKRNVFSCDRIVRQSWDRTSLCARCCVRIHFLGRQSLGIFRKNISIIMVDWVTTVAKLITFQARRKAVLCIFCSLNGSPVLKSYSKVKLCFFFNAKSVQVLLPTIKLLLLKEYCF